jgi:hypothetical protein
LFVADEKGVCFKLFKTKVTEERIDEVMTKYKNKLNGWKPTFNNGFELYLQNGNDWKKVDASKMWSTLNEWGKPAKAWEGMPQDAIDYLMSLPEWDEAIFTRITGLVPTKKDDEIEKAIKLLQEKGRIKDGKIIV